MADFKLPMLLTQSWEEVHGSTAQYSICTIQTQEKEITSKHKYSNSKIIRK